MKHKIYYATSNPTKFFEAYEFFQKNMPQVDLEQFSDDIPELQSLNQEEIAVGKAREAWSRLQAPVLAEDSGVYFTKYHEFPGTLTKFIYKALGMDGISRLVSDGDKAYFQLHLVYCDGKDRYTIFKGKIEGSILIPKKFIAPESAPYCDIFVPDGSEKTYTELRQIHKLAQFNFRVKAFEQFACWYNQR